MFLKNTVLKELMPYPSWVNIIRYFRLIVNYLDIIFIVPLIWAGFRGFKKGLIIEVSTLIAFGLGIWGGIHFLILLRNYFLTV